MATSPRKTGPHPPTHARPPRTLPAPPTFARAFVSAALGDRRVCGFLAKADLGIDGYGKSTLLTIDYKPGEFVDAARVRKAMDAMIERANRECAGFVVLHYEILGISYVDAVTQSISPA